MRGEVQLLENVFQGHNFVGFRMEKLHKGGNKLFLLHAFAGFLFFVLSHIFKSF